MFVWVGKWMFFSSGRRSFRIRAKNDWRIEVAKEPSQSPGAVSPASLAYSSMLKVTR